MRPLRLLAPFDPENGFPVLYHITSRVVEKRFIFKERERARFLKLAKGYAVFSGFELVSWCLMSNHFHLLVRVPVQDVKAISDAELVERLKHVLNPQRMENIIARLEGAVDPSQRAGILESFRKRVGHLPSYVKAVKQEFSQWFNHVNQREGTLWEGRYHSTLIEDCGGENPSGEMNGAGEIARIVAAYIDMNPVRAKVEGDPKDCGWSSYGAALGGDRMALQGLRLLWGRPNEGFENEQHGKADGGKRVVENGGISDQRYLQMHRTWLLKGHDVQDAVVTAKRDSAATDDSEPLPRGRPPRLTGLRGLRILGSPGFISRVGVATVSLKS